ncbi:MAG: ABC transporter ATP-binding protein [Lachnotalea sp.]
MSLLEVKNLCKSFKNFQLQDVTFDLPKGYVMGYVGQNGAGKTTTINLITNLCNAQKGEVHIDGISYHDNPQQFKEYIGYIGDESYFPKEFRLKDVRFILKTLYNSFNEDSFDKLIKKWELPEKQKIAEYSRGMKVKLMFASVLARETKLLILDEATNGLDPVMRAEILQVLQDYIQDGERSIFFSTHMLNDLEQIADYIVFIDHGRILLNKTKDDMLESYVLIRGDYHELTSNQKSKLIGITKGEFNFEAILLTNEAIGFDNRYVIEKPTIDQIMLHHIKNGGN